LRESASGGRPTLSVIIPVYNDSGRLADCLDRLLQSEYRDFEAIVVDDGSTDDGNNVARAHGVQLICMPGRSGPAAARNAGADVARGDYLVFIDADVLVHADTLGGLARTFSEDETVDAVFGSYDTSPSAPNFISHYKNLFHHYVHQMSHEQASTFWSGCGAVKRASFIEVGGFDTSFKRPTVEDIELGMRLRRTGHQIVLNKQVQVTHAKRWSLMGMIASDIRDRAIPWTHLILREKSLPDDLNLTWVQRISAAVAYALFTVLTVGAVHHPALLIIPLLFVVLILAVDYWSAKTRIPTAARWAGAVVMLAALAAAGLLLHELTLIALVLAVTLVALNSGFYGFFLRERNALFAVAIFPLHLLYFAYSGLGFAVGAIGYWLRTRPNGQCAP
jgi:glycosyltransferase involved in cell wall biosynthesis